MVGSVDWPFSWARAEIISHLIERSGRRHRTHLHNPRHYPLPDIMWLIRVNQEER